ncbi:S-type pyocin family protein [Pseudomonas synxantha BG33R]|uniref:S-type pyocin domain-containing protein n=1 Tax=Pseudomonas synxantha TaxID=47883 RepID=UPI00025FEE57|nr:S-type pyocin domain-containing protein [Pseudomonas synxantha]EIK68919.1 S-type pyocin family protein [Pseudomonas synxantha BG33R]
MAQQGWQPGQPLELKPTIITAGRRNTYWGGEGGGYAGSGDGWGLQEGPRRGEGDRSRFKQFDFPSTTADFIGEQKYNQSLIDAEYSARFATLTTETERELAEKQQAAKASQPLTETASAILDQKIALEIIDAKKTKYANTAPLIYGLYDQSPFYLMENLTYTKLRETLASSDPIRNLGDTYTLYDNVWRAAQELKALSLSIDILAKKLSGLAKARQTLEANLAEHDPGWANLHNEYLKAIADELEIQVQLLPEYLQVELTSLAGSVVGLTPDQTLMLYKNTLDKMIEETMAAIKPIDPPLAINRNGLMIYYPAANPRVTPPLSKPELEGLKQLIYLQQNTALGVRWLSHHDFVLNSESARFLANASNAISDLAGRAQQVATAQARIEAVRATNTYRLSGTASATQAIVMTSVGTIATAEGITITLQAAIRSAVAALTELVASTASGLMVGVSALVYSPKLANGELPERYALGTPISTLVPDLNESTITSAVNGTIDLPVRMSSKTATDGRSEVLVVTADGTSVPSKVKVVAATYDPGQKVYTVTTSDIPPRTLIWTPIVAPGDSSTTLPVDQSEPPVYTGATVTPVEGRIDSFPAAAEAGFDDFITVFPVNSGLPPIYVFFRDRREDPGVVTGNGQSITGSWLGAASQGEGSPIPSQIADKLKGQEFKNFRAFREAFWKTVANDSELASQFKRQNLSIMLDGKTPFSSKSEWVGESVKFEIHHKIFISQGGEIFDIDNIYIVTPKRHKEIHRKGI